MDEQMKAAINTYQSVVELKQLVLGVVGERDQLRQKLEAVEAEAIEYIDYRNQAVISRNAMEKERDQLRADLAAANELAAQWESVAKDSASTLMDAAWFLRQALSFEMAHRCMTIAATTPASALAAHDAEVRKQVLEKVKDICVRGYNEPRYVTSDDIDKLMADEAGKVSHE